MKKMIKKLISAALITATVCASAVGAGAAGSYFSEEGFTYGVENGTAYVHSYEGAEWDVVIREAFLGKYNVTAVEHHAFFGNETMETLSFYDAVYLESIGSYAFSQCTSLLYTNITPSIRSIGNNAFDSCTSLSYVRFMKGSLTEIPDQCFYGCTSLETVVLNNEPTRIGKLAFANCSALEKIVIPDTVTDIGENAFDGCDDLVIYCTKGSYALSWAKENGVMYYVTDAEPETIRFLRGDADGDGAITILDATKVQRLLANLVDDADGMIALRGDADGDGSLNILDATRIQRAIAGFTVENIGEFAEVTLP